MNQSVARCARLSVAALFALLSLAYPLLLNPVQVAAQSAMSGTGTFSDPYQITTCDQLGDINSDLSAYYVLANDIDCGSVTASPTTFPIGSSSSFSGSFDGQGHAITGVTINWSATDYVGLFSRLSGSAAVQKLSVTANVTADSGTNVGILAGSASNGAYINRVDTHGSVSCSNNCGGVIGTMEDSSNLSQSWSDASVGGSGYTYGGLVGWVNGNSANIADVYYSGDVTPSGGTSNYTGGIVGFANHLALTNAYSTGTVTGGQGVGGIAGTLVSSTVSHTFSTANVNGVGMGPLFGDSISSTTSDNYYYDRYSMPSDGYGSIGVNSAQDFIQNSTSPVFSTWSFSAAWVVEYKDYPALKPVQSPVMLCEPPTSTETTIGAHCLVSPRGWGIPTWQARYRQQGASTWNNLTLSDAHIGQVSVIGLQPSTWYDVQFSYTNNYGASPWGTVQILTADATPAVSSGQTATATPTVTNILKAIRKSSSLGTTPVVNTDVAADVIPAHVPADATAAISRTDIAEPTYGSDTMTKSTPESKTSMPQTKNTSSLSRVGFWLIGLALLVIVGRLVFAARPKKHKKHRKTK